MISYLEFEKPVAALDARIAELPEGTIAELTLDEILLLRRRASGDVTIAEPFPLPLPAGFDTGMRVFGHPVHCKP